MDPDTGAPRDELHPETVNWLKTHGIEYTKLSDVLKAGPCPKVTYHFQSHVFNYSIALIMTFTFGPAGTSGSTRGHHTCQQLRYIKRTKNPKIHHSAA